MYNWNKKPGKAYVTSGIGFGRTPLAAFDHAELNANIMATNAIKVSSFIPPNWELLNDKQALKALTGSGAFLPMAYAYETSNTQPVAASLVIGLNQDKAKASIIIEHAGVGITKEESLRESEDCAKETFAFRSWKMERMIKVFEEAIPGNGNFACALVAVLFFPEEG